MTGYSVCGNFVGAVARWHYLLFDNGNLIRQWWPGEGVWGSSEVWTESGWRKIREDEISWVFPAQETLQ